MRQPSPRSATSSMQPSSSGTGWWQPHLTSRCITTRGLNQHGDHYERIINLATALEAILTGGDADTEGIGLRLGTRAATLLWTDSDPGRAIFDDVKHLYNLRSELVHGVRIAEKDLLKWLGAVSVVPEDAPMASRSPSP